jgi:hypothetical protein
VQVSGTGDASAPNVAANISASADLAGKPLGSVWCDEGYSNNLVQWTTALACWNAP